MLPKAVQGAVRPPVLITWLRDDGSIEDLTGAILTGKINGPAEVRNIAGALALVNAEIGEFSWTYHPDDVEFAGIFEVQFIASYGLPPSPGKTFATSWEVKGSL